MTAETTTEEPENERSFDKAIPDEPSIQEPRNDSPDDGQPEDSVADPVAEAAKYRDLYLRTQADFENFRKRAAREREESVRYANQSLLERLLPILDNFELGLDAAGKTPGAGGILQGMAMVKKQLEDFLGDSGLVIIDAEGSIFDPNLHEAVGQETSGNVEEGTVLRQLRKGYKLRDRLVRPATVIVSKGADGESL